MGGESGFRECPQTHDLDLGIHGSTPENEVSDFRSGFLDRTHPFFFRIWYQTAACAPAACGFFSLATSPSIRVKVWITRSSEKMNEPHSFR